jgi:Tol biopolymer transport system component
LKIQFNPTRVDRVSGSTMLSGFDNIYGYALSQREDKLVVSGRSQDSRTGTCAIFVLDLIGGNVKKVLERSSCDWKSAWHELSLSPTGEQAVATRDSHLELIDLVHGSVRDLGELDNAGWSPDGKWIAAVKWRGELVLVDSSNFSQRRLRGYCPLKPQWSPDSRYLLIWKYHLFRCGFSLDVDGPATLLTLEIATGKRSTIRSSLCRIQGVTGWIRDEIVH